MSQCAKLGERPCTSRLTTDHCCRKHVIIRQCNSHVTQFYYSMDNTGLQDACVWYANLLFSITFIKQACKCAILIGNPPWTQIALYVDLFITISQYLNIRWTSEGLLYCDGAWISLKGVWIATYIHYFRCKVATHRCDNFILGLT